MNKVGAFSYALMLFLFLGGVEVISVFLSYTFDVGIFFKYVIYCCLGLFFSFLPLRMNKFEGLSPFSLSFSFSFSVFLYSFLIGVAFSFCQFGLAAVQILFLLNFFGDNFFDSITSFNFSEQRKVMEGYFNANILFFVLFFLKAFLVAPIVEEVYLRGGVFRLSLSSLGFTLSTLLSGGFFLLIHGFDWILSLMFFSFISSYIYYSSKNIFSSIVFHSSYNFSFWVFKGVGGMDYFLSKPASMLHEPRIWILEISVMAFFLGVIVLLLLPFYKGL
jgi:membrane protease YdiL (CAAX protease family)